MYAYCNSNPVYYIDKMGRIPFANAFYKFYESFEMIGYDDPYLGRITYKTYITKQTQEAGIFYIAKSDSVSNGESKSVGINLWGRKNNEIGHTDTDIYLSIGITPWFNISISIGATGITLSVGFNINGTTHEVSIGIGLGLIIVIALVLITGGEVVVLA